jgi:hypothetical protein
MVHPRTALLRLNQGTYYFENIANQGFAPALRDTVSQFAQEHVPSTIKRSLTN